MDTIKTLLIAAIPSIISAMAVWTLQKKLTHAEEERKKREGKQEKLQMIVLESVNGAIDLSIATATAIQRNPANRCNGDMHAALDSIAETKKKQQKMLTEAGLHNLMHE